MSELPSECQVSFHNTYKRFSASLKYSFMQFCGKEYPSKSLEHHEKAECEERPTNCRFNRIGCQWKGPIHEGENK